MRWSKNPPLPADWSAKAEEAIAVQQSLRHRVELTNRFDTLELIAGVDVSYDIVSNQSFAFIVLMQRQELVPLVSVSAKLPTEFPYIPGLLSFREIPVVLEALEQLPHKPDLLMVDGQGIAHPRRLGIAAHLGVLTDIPAVGVAKSRLTGIYDEPANRRGAHTPLMDKHQQIGTVLRSKEGCLPLFISPGHRIDQQTSLDVVMGCLTRYRLPEPTRIADKHSKEGKWPLIQPQAARQASFL